MKELKNLIVNALTSEYPLDEAIRQVNEAEIIIKGDSVRVIYSNGKSDKYELITIEKLILVDKKSNNMTIEESVKKEVEFCESIDCEKNDSGQFIYESKNKKSAINLPFILLEYKDWLVDNGLITLKK